MEGRSAFDILFEMNLPHILEKIFGHLDYESYKKCYEVNSAWHELLTSDPYLRRAKAVFREGILGDEKKLQDAIKGGDMDEIKRLLSYQLVDVNKTGNDEFGLAPLHDAALGGHADVVQMLIDRGAEPNKEKTRLQRNDWSPHGREVFNSPVAHLILWFSSAFRPNCCTCTLRKCAVLSQFQ